MQARVRDAPLRRTLHRRGPLAQAMISLFRPSLPVLLPPGGRNHELGETPPRWPCPCVPVTHLKTVVRNTWCSGYTLFPSQAPSGARGDFVVCACVCVYIEVWAPCSRGSYARRATRCEASSYAVAGHHPRHPTTSPKSPATTSDTLSSSTSALHITSRRYELRELALLLGMCGQLVHQTFINCEGHFFFHFRSFLASCGKTKEYASGDVVPCMN